MLRGEKRKLEGFEKALEELRSEIAELERQLAAGNVAAAKAIAEKKLEIEVIERGLPDMRRKVAEIEQQLRSQLPELRRRYNESVQPLRQLFHKISMNLDELDGLLEKLKQVNDEAVDLWNQLSSVCHDLGETAGPSSHLLTIPQPLQTIRVEIQNFRQWISRTAWREKR
ncbi:MAG: hypothetical protein QXG52_09015 [Candidatus Caldarchaeum sp.]